jgi:hypothetical protein
MEEEERIELTEDGRERGRVFVGEVDMFGVRRADNGPYDFVCLGWAQKW